MRYVSTSQAVWLAALDQESNSYGLIQTDTNLTNWLFMANGVALLDFEVCCRGYYVFDVGRLMHMFSQISAHPSELHEALLAGYQRTRPVPQLQAAALHTGMLMSLIDAVVWLCTLSSELRSPGSALTLRIWLDQIHVANGQTFTH